ncbi:hypothetical protein C8R46DRAFT_1318092 [Mycena filopes]|nr:hypothetical protein C8R46DRAFT_1318092 [Mycena filopes]
MSFALTFARPTLLESPVVAPDGNVHFTTSSTHGSHGRKRTTVTAASGRVGVINWRDDLFIIDGVEKKCDEPKAHTGGAFGSERVWTWAIERPYMLKYDNATREVLATPNFSGVAGPVHFKVYDPALGQENENENENAAVLRFPAEIQDETERMFLLMAMLQTEMLREDSCGHWASIPLRDM